MDEKNTNSTDDTYSFIDDPAREQTEFAFKYYLKKYGERYAPYLVISHSIYELVWTIHKEISGNDGISLTEIISEELNNISNRISDLQ